VRDSNPRPPDYKTDLAEIGAARRMSPRCDGRRPLAPLLV
jgi:hypothetical protein